MLDVVVLAVGTVRSPAIRSLCDMYRKRSAPFGRVAFIEVSAEPFKNNGEKQRSKDKEGERILKVIEKEKRNGSVIVLLEEKGVEMTSREFSEFIRKNQNQRIIFVIGGALGVSDAVRKKISNTCALSQMTFPHELVRVLLLEQIYRAATILTEKEYHY